KSGSERRSYRLPALPLTRPREVQGSEETGSARDDAAGPLGGQGAPATVGAYCPHPSLTTSKSEALSVPDAGVRVSLFQRVSKVPLMYMSEPLSATISP